MNSLVDLYKEHEFNNLALHERGFALGVITLGLIKNYGSPELGFFAVLSVGFFQYLARPRSIPSFATFS